MKRYVVLDKKVGETPLETVYAWKRENPIYENIPASYAGRLDPMAEGKLLILLGEECKKQARYTALDKEYEVEILLDVGSDTGDALGLVEYSPKETSRGFVEQHLNEVLRKEQGTHVRSYPKFSSKTVQGKPLFLYALEGTIGTIAIPTHQEHIYETKHLETKLTDTFALRAHIETYLAKVPITKEPSKALGADFRIKEVQKSWEKLFNTIAQRKFVVLRLRVVCGSGTYMRSLSGRIGEALGTKALALSIRRTTIGRYWMGLWLTRY